MIVGSLSIMYIYSMNIITLFRPVGPEELALIESQWLAAFPAKIAGAAYFLPGNE